MKTSLATLVMVGSVWLGACASAPMNTQALQQARDEVQTLSQHPAATEISSRELSAARGSLAQAEDALKLKKQEDVDHYSYVALRQRAARGRELPG